MKRQKKAKEKEPEELRKRWCLDLAFRLGKVANVVSQKVETTVTWAEKKVSAAGMFLTGGHGKSRLPKNRVKILADPSEKLISPIQKEIKAIVGISGLTAALRKMNEINLRHAGHPVIHRLLSQVKALSPAEQEMLARQFIDRLLSNPVFDQASGAFLARPKMTEDDVRKRVDAFIECFYPILGNLGLSLEEQNLLREMNDEVMRPFKDLVQFYLKPKKFSQKMKRLWRMQRIFLKIIKLIHLTKAFVSEVEKPAYGIDAMNNDRRSPEGDLCPISGEESLL